MRLEQFEYIIAIAQYHSLSQAAKALFITQPTLSINLQNIEAEVGFPVFTRSYKGMELTGKGQELYEIALQIQQQIKGVKRLSQAGPSDAKINLAAVPVFCNAAMLMLLKQIKQIRPELKLYIHETAREDALLELINKKANMSVGLYIAGEAGQLYQTAARNRLVLEPLYKDSMFVFLPKNHPLTEQTQIRLRQLEKETIILLRDGTNEFPLEECIPESMIGLCYSFKERDSVLKAVSKGMGYAVLPGLMAVDNIYVDTELVTVLPIADQGVPITLYLAYSVSKPLTTEEQLIKRVLIQMFHEIRKREVKQFPLEPDENVMEMDFFY